MIGSVDFRSTGIIGSSFLRLFVFGFGLSTVSSASFPVVTVSGCLPLELGRVTVLGCKQISRVAAMFAGLMSNLCVNPKVISSSLCWLAMFDS